MQADKASRQPAAPCRLKHRPVMALEGVHAAARDSCASVTLQVNGHACLVQAEPAARQPAVTPQYTDSVSEAIQSTAEPSNQRLTGR